MAQLDMDPSKYLELINNCDENAPLLSATPLGQYLDHIPLNSVQPSDLTQFHQSLNVEQLISTREGLARDYRGLAELMGCSSIELEARFKRSYNPTKCLVDALKMDKRQGRPTSVTDLLKLIEKLERFDVLDDLLPTLIRIVNESQNNHQLAQLRGTSRSFRENDFGEIQRPHEGEAAVGGGGVQQYKYDAFLCYAPEDEDYAQDIMITLEKHNKRIVTTDNLLAGQFEYDAIVQMIAVECRKVIIILTPNFLESRECEFQAKFANEIAIKSGWFPKIIPILYEPFDDSKLPPLIRGVSKIDMTHANKRHWQLKNLLGSLDYDGHHSRVMPPDRKNRLTMMNSHQQPLVSIQEPDDFKLGAEKALDETGPRAGASGISTGGHNHRLDVPSGPFVDLAQSQGSSANLSHTHLGPMFESSLSSTQMDLSESLSSRCSPTSQNESGGSPHRFMNLIRSFTRRVRGSSLSLSPSSSSRNILIPSTLSNSGSNLAEDSDCLDKR